MIRPTEPKVVSHVYRLVGLFASVVTLAGTTVLAIERSRYEDSIHEFGSSEFGAVAAAVGVACAALALALSTKTDTRRLRQVSTFVVFTGCAFLVFAASNHDNANEPISLAFAIVILGIPIAQVRLHRWMRRLSINDVLVSVVLWAALFFHTIAVPVIAVKAAVCSDDDCTPLPWFSSLGTIGLLWMLVGLAGLRVDSK